MNIDKMIIWIDSILRFCQIVQQINSKRKGLSIQWLKKGQWNLVVLERKIENSEKESWGEKDQKSKN